MARPEARLSTEGFQGCEETTEPDLLCLTLGGRRWECYLVRRRPGGVMLALPAGVLPPSRLATAQRAGPRALVGPNKRVEVRAVSRDGAAEDEGVPLLEVQLIDFNEAVAADLGLLDGGAEDLHGFDQSGALPEPSELLSSAAAWVGELRLENPPPARATAQKLKRLCRRRARQRRRRKPFGRPTSAKRGNTSGWEYKDVCMALVGARRALEMPATYGWSWRARRPRGRRRSCGINKNNNNSRHRGTSLQPRTQGQ